MRFVRGQTLREAVAVYHQKRERGELGALDLRSLLTAFVGVCNAVAYAHSRGFVHRDLKPANVVLGDFGEVIVLDWGLAKEVRPGGPDAATTDASAPAPSPSHTAEPTLEGQVLGTPAYMAPEQADGRLADIDARTDVYGLGAILYELLTGQPPFTGASTEEVQSSVRTLAPERPRDRVAGTPRALEAVCLKALAKKPADRYPSAKTLADDVLHFQADEPTTAYREPLAARAWRWSRRHRSLVTALVAALVVAVPILVAVVLLNESEARERKAREREEIARKDEETARERAQTNYHRSLRAADALAEELARGIRPIAGTESKTVIGILDRAKAITDDLLTDPDPAPEALERKARMLVQFADLYRETNRTTPARESAEQSLAIYERLLTLRPGDRNLRIERAKARNRLGWALFDQARFAEALDSFRGCISELEAVGVDDDPVLAATFLASAYTFGANIVVAFGDHDEAEKMYKRGLDIRRKALAAAKDNLTVRMQVAISLERYAVFLARYRGSREGGLRLLREARKEMEAVCAADPSDSVLHQQLVKILSNIAEFADPAEAGAAVGAGEKIVERFLRRDPDHNGWQRENVRFTFSRIVSKLKKPHELTPEVYWELRKAERKMLEDILVVIRQRNAQDPENYLWRQDIGNIETSLAMSHMHIAIGEAARAFVRVPPPLFAVGDTLIAAVGTADAVRTAMAHLARASELCRSAITHQDAVLARAPANTEIETLTINVRYGLWQIERERADRFNTVVAQLDYSVRQLELAHRLIAVHPTSAFWAGAVLRAYFSVLTQWRMVLDPPDWELLTRPEVMALLMRGATAVANPPENLRPALRDAGAPTRRMIAKMLRDTDARGALPPEGKKALEKLPQEEK